MPYSSNDTFEGSGGEEMTTAVFIKPLWALIAVCIVGIILFAYLSYKSKLKEDNKYGRRNQ
jgi:ABC-type Mn2+/Zn2+ transport system permease subunit